MERGRHKELLKLGGVLRNVEETTKSEAQEQQASVAES